MNNLAILNAIVMGLALLTVCEMCLLYLKFGAMDARESS